MKEGISRRDVLKMLGLGVVAANIPACESGILADTCKNPETTTESLEYKVEFAETLSERQRGYVLGVINREMAKIEPRFRQGVARIVVQTSDFAKECGCAGNYVDFGDTINIVGPPKGQSESGESTDHIRLSSFQFSMIQSVPHEVGHHVESIGGAVERYVEIEPRIHQFYGPEGASDFGGNDARQEDFAEGFRLFGSNPYIFPLFLNNVDKNYKNKYLVLQDDIFCGQEPAVKNVERAWDEIMSKLDVFEANSDPQEILLNAKAKLQETDPKWLEDKRFSVFLRYLEFSVLLKGPKALKGESGYQIFTERYQELKAAAQDVQWADLEAQIDITYGINISMLFVQGSRVDQTIEFSVELLRKILTNRLVLEGQQISLRQIIGHRLVFLERKTEARAILEEAAGLFAETIEADRILKSLDKL